MVWFELMVSVVTRNIKNASWSQTWGTYIQSRTYSSESMSSLTLQKKVEDPCRMQLWDKKRKFLTAQMTQIGFSFESAGLGSRKSSVTILIPDVLEMFVTSKQCSPLNSESCRLCLYMDFLLLSSEFTSFQLHSIKMRGDRT